MATEDFSFPKISQTPPCFIESPPLWRASNSTLPRHEETERGGDLKGEDDFSTTKYSQRKSFSCIEGSMKTATEDEEEKMDMLWEDLNEELSKSCGSRPDSGVSPGIVVEFGRMQKALKLSKTGISGKRSSVVVFMKVLKNLFLLHKSHGTVKKRACK
ncbi:hypothetical protein F0562_002935 [Nyssa sinensis]|uniref:Uncharacterized protein n=1 Tax=Nyssa sinensis TaxID=561372 RepID=A0A5J5BUE6_9ASTE|nr:hypothetical protein F0562_002935 [Nyssa sinensis]